MTDSGGETRTPRQEAILAAAVRLFFQFGYRKTSMEDVAAAAEVSRQTLYLQFQNKERLFRSALEYLTAHLLSSIRLLAGRKDMPVDKVLLGIFELLCGDAANAGTVNTAELLAIARSQERAIVAHFEARVLDIIADVLTQTGTASYWERRGIGAKALAAHLLDSSAGAKAMAGSLNAYRDRMALAIRIVMNGAEERKGETG